MLNEFATWYVGRMTELLPGRLRGAVDVGPDALTVTPAPAGAPTTVAFAHRQRGREQQLGSFALDRTGVVEARALLGGRAWPEVALCLPRNMLLERIVTLPLAAEMGLAQVIGFEMDRYTPFNADEVFWSVHVVARDREQGRLRARLVLLPRAVAAPAQEALAELGLVATLAEGQVADGTLRRIPLRGDAEAGNRRSRRLLAVTLGVAGVLALAAAGMPFLRQSWTSDGIEARIAALQPKVNEADALRRRLLAQSAGSDAIATEEVRLGSPLQAISALTELLPDDTYLTALTLHQRQVAIEGQSAAAARLIGVLSSDPVIRNPAFAAPVTRADDGTDLFSIKAEARS